MKLFDNIVSTRLAVINLLYRGQWCILEVLLIFFSKNLKTLRRNNVLIPGQSIANLRWELISYEAGEPALDGSIFEYCFTYA